MYGERGREAVGSLDESAPLVRCFEGGSGPEIVMCIPREETGAQVGSSDAGGLLGWDDLLGLTRRKINRAMTRRRRRRRTFRFRDFL
jgi:hypothetical protein